MTYEEVKGFLDHMRETCMEDRQALKLKVRSLESALRRLVDESLVIMEPIARLPEGKLSAAYFNLWYEALTDARAALRNDGSPCPIQGPHDCDRSDHGSR